MTRFEKTRRRGVVAIGTLALVSAGLISWAAGPAEAITVSTETELRDAFADPDETLIDLANDITLSQGCDDGPNFGEVRRPSSNADLTLDGHGFTVTQTCPDAGVFGHNGGFALTFQNVTITGGNQDNTDTCFGGGIRTSAEVTIINSAILDNSAACAGGGVSVAAELHISNSTIAFNSTGGEGGGIFNSANEAPFTLTNSTVTNNSAGNGLPGGGVRTFGAAVVVYSTIVDNTAEDGANLSGYTDGGATLEIFGTVVALPQGGGTNCAGFVTQESNGFNWDDDASCPFDSTGDHSDAGNPEVGALGDNGGDTPTRLPAPTSGLIDAIPLANCEDDGAAGITDDQRFFPRPAGMGCDIGAVEVQPEPPPPPPPPPGPPGPSPIRIVPSFTG